MKHNLPRGETLSMRGEFTIPETVQTPMVITTLNPDRAMVGLWVDGSAYYGLLRLGSDRGFLSLESFSF